MQDMANMPETRQSGMRDCPESTGRTGGEAVFGRQPTGASEAQPVAGPGATPDGQARQSVPGWETAQPMRGAREMGGSQAAGECNPGSAPAPYPYPVWATNEAAGDEANGRKGAGYQQAAGQPMEHSCDCSEGSGQTGGPETVQTRVGPQHWQQPGNPPTRPFAGAAPGAYGAAPAHPRGPMPARPQPPFGAAGYQGMHAGMQGHQGMPGAPADWSEAPFGPWGAAPEGYQQAYGYGPTSAQAPHSCCHGGAQGPGHPKHDSHRHGQWMDLVNDLANGNADPSRLMACLGSLDTQFWKGALVGVAATLLLTNNTVKDAIVGALSGIFGGSRPETRDQQS